MSSATHSCVICGEVGLSEAEVQSHLFIHAEVSPSCPFCSLSSVSLDDLHFHIAVAHAETGVSAGKSSPAESPLPPPGKIRPPSPLVPASCGRAQNGEGASDLLRGERSSSRTPFRDGHRSASDAHEHSARAVAEKPPFIATQSGSGARLNSPASGTTTPVRQTGGYRGELSERDSSENRTERRGEGSAVKDPPRSPRRGEHRPPAPSQGSWKSRSPSGGQKADGAQTLDGARAADPTHPRRENHASLQARLGEPRSERRRLDCGVSDGGSTEAEGSAASAPRCGRNGAEDTLVECPFCGLKGSGEQQMLRHLQSVHADDMDTPQKEAKPPPSHQGGERRVGRGACPVCDATFHSERELQVHVENHFSGGDDGAMADELLAEALQDEEVARRQEDRQEVDEFRRLQREHGMDGRGGFARQAQRSLQRDMERGAISPLDMHVRRAELLRGIADGRDDGATRTAGPTAALARLYGSIGGTAARDVTRVWLSADTSHYCGGGGDRGWGCGYRNLQMLLSSLARLPQFQFLGLQDGARMPGIPRLQALVEEAWAQGFDPQGASSFAGKLRGTRAWIGTTELYALLTSQRVRCRIVDFHRATGEGGTHPLLFAWVRRYFRGEGRDRSPPPGQLLVATQLPPLYLQHRGHSRTVVGVEERRDGTASLIIFDPGHSGQTMERLLRVAGGNASAVTATLRAFRRPLGALRHSQYQVLAAGTTALTDAEREARRAASQVFVAERIP